MTSPNVGTKHMLEDVSNTAPPAAKKPKKTFTGKQIELKVESATTEQITPLLVDIYTNHTYDAKTLELFLTRIDVKSRCFCCKQQKKDMRDLDHLMVCVKCEVSQKTYNRTEITDWFGLSKGEANKITHSLGTSGYGGVKYVFRLGSVVDAIAENKKLAKKVAKYQKEYYFDMPDTMGDFDKAKTKEEKNKTLCGALAKVSSDKELKEFFLQSVKKVRELKEVGGFLEAL